MIDWLKVILTCIQAVGAVARWADNRQLMQAGAMSLIASAMKGQADDIAKAIKARAAVADAAKRDPASVLRDDDGFRRD